MERFPLFWQSVQWLSWHISSYSGSAGCNDESCITDEAKIWSSSSCFWMYNYSLLPNMTNWQKAVNFTFQVFSVILDIFYTCISCVEWKKKLPIHRLTTPWVHIVCMFTSIRRRSNVHLFTEPTCICTRLKSISRGVFSIVPACWSRDKAADHMLDSIGHRCAPNRSQGERDGMSSRCGCVFLNFDVNKICHEKMLCSCSSHGLNNRAHTYYMPM